MTRAEPAGSLPVFSCVRPAKPISCLTLALLAAACHRPTPAERAAQDARDVAAVEAAQTVKPPVQPLRPGPVSPAVRKLFHLTDAGCEFRTAAGAEPVLVAGRAKAVLSIGGEPAILAADSGSAELVAGARVRYAGRTHWAQLARAPDRLTIRDRYERIVYQAAGTLTCHGAAAAQPPNAKRAKSV